MKIGFFGLLAIMLIGLKLSGVLHTSWFWVIFIPVAIPFLAVFLGLVIMLSYKALGKQK